MKLRYHLLYRNNAVALTGSLVGETLVRFTCLNQSAFQDKECLEVSTEICIEVGGCLIAVMVTMTDASRKFSVSNKASTESFFICRGHCIYSAHMPIDLLTAPITINMRIFIVSFVIVSFVIAPLVGCVLWWRHASRARTIPMVQNKFSTPKACREILACNRYASGERNTIPAVESRAGPNQRLVKAFNIDNAFTTKDDQYRKSFHREAKAKMSSLEEVDWKRIAGKAEALIHHGLGGKQCCLDSLVRSTSLKITLHTMFKLDPMEMKDEVVEEITSSINDLWVESKKPGEPSVPLKHKLTQALAELFPGAEFSGKESPLNFILPAYETLWRVVLSGFIEVIFREGALPGWKYELVRFIEEPTIDKLKSASHDTSVSVESITNEALRLFPSTKSVYREFRMDTKETTDIVIADIEKCHRIRSIWGDDANKFDPSRWKNLEAQTKEAKAAKEAFMPFGYREFTCPAKSVYGPMIIAVLVAALAKNITTEKWTLELYRAGSEVGHGLMGDEDLIADRKTYEKIIIREKETD